MNEQKIVKLAEQTESLFVLLLRAYAQYLFLRPMMVDVELIARHGAAGKRGDGEPYLITRPAHRLPMGEDRGVTLRCGLLRVLLNREVVFPLREKLRCKAGDRLVDGVERRLPRCRQRIAERDGLEGIERPIGRLKGGAAQLAELPRKVAPRSRDGGNCKRKRHPG